MAMQVHISGIDVYRIQPQRGLIGFVNFLIDESIVINGVSIYEKLDGTGIRLVYPIRKLLNGKQINLIHPISQGIGSHIEQQVSQHLALRQNIGAKDAEPRAATKIK